METWQGLAVEYSGIEDDAGCKNNSRPDYTVDLGTIHSEEEVEAIDITVFLAV